MNAQPREVPAVFHRARMNARESLIVSNRSLVTTSQPPYRRTRDPIRAGRGWEVPATRMQDRLPLPPLQQSFLFRDLSELFGSEALLTIDRKDRKDCLEQRWWR